MIDSLFDWVKDYKWWIVAASTAMFVISLAALPVVVVRLPPDYLLRRKRRSWHDSAHPALRLAVLILKNVVGAVLLAAGLVMLVTPGQGILAILVGLVLLDIPGKRKLLVKIAGQKKVLSSLNRLRQRFGKPPMMVKRS